MPTRLSRAHWPSPLLGNFDMSCAVPESGRPTAVASAHAAIKCLVRISVLPLKEIPACSDTACASMIHGLPALGSSLPSSGEDHDPDAALRFAGYRTPDRA